MAFGDRLAALRKTMGLSQRNLAELVKVHATQIQRYETGQIQPNLAVLKRLAVTLNVTADALIFDENERGPTGDDFKLILEAVDQFDPEERNAARTVMTGLILQHQARRFAKAS
jgi:transcriptional regulator with XRE-family HTH domain